jgi:CheY-like chemotaxis protein
MVLPGEWPVDDRLAVLVVDDDPDIRETLREVIEAEGFPVVTAAHGRAALEALALGLRPSLILLDLMMPAMSGWDVLAALREDRALAEIPVAVISASGEKAPPPGATHFLRKPIELDALLDVLRDPRGRGPRRVPRLPSAPEVRNSGGAPM